MVVILTIIHYTELIIDFKSKTDVILNSLITIICVATKPLIAVLLDLFL